MLSDNELRVLASFFPEVKERTAKDIERATGLSHEPAFRILKSLVKNKYLKGRKVGKTNVYEFVFSDDTYFVYTYFVMKKLDSFKHQHALMFRRLQEFSNSVDSNCIVLFGSYAKGMQTERSDVDVLVVAEKKESEKNALIFKTKYNLNIKPVVVHPKDFKNIKKDNIVFYDDLIKFGLVFNGIEWFFKEVYKNGPFT